MSTQGLWIPETSPPQLSPDAYHAISLRVLEHGVTDAAHTGLADLQTRHEPLAEYLDRLGFILNDISHEGLWPERVLKIGAALALIGYQESGYFQVIDEDTVEAGATIAAIEGIPEAYLTRFFQDEMLVELLETTHEVPEFTHDQGGSAQVLGIGAGCTRYYMQHAIAA